MGFLNDHRYDPSEIYDEEFHEEIKAIPDPTIEPKEILHEFLQVLHTLGNWQPLPSAVWNSQPALLCT